MCVECDINKSKLPRRRRKDPRNRILGSLTLSAECPPVHLLTPPGLFVRVPWRSTLTIERLFVRDTRYLRPEDGYVRNPRGGQRTLGRGRCHLCVLNGPHQSRRVG